VRVALAIIGSLLLLIWGVNAMYVGFTHDGPPPNGTGWGIFGVVLFLAGLGGPGLIAKRISEGRRALATFDRPSAPVGEVRPDLPPPPATHAEDLMPSSNEGSPKTRSSSSLITLALWLAVVGVVAITFVHARSSSQQSAQDSALLHWGSTIGHSGVLTLERDQNTYARMGNQGLDATQVENQLLSLADSIKALESQPPPPNATVATAWSNVLTSAYSVYNDTYLAISQRDESLLNQARVDIAHLNAAKRQFLAVVKGL